jgi:hypothetical protein
MEISLRNNDYDYEGNIVGEGLVTVDYIKLANTIIQYDSSTRSSCYLINDTLKVFKPYEYHIDIINPAKLEVKTNIGILYGDVILPGIGNVKFEKDSMAIGESTRIIFNGTADYFTISYSYYFINDSALGVHWGTFITNKHEIIIDSAEFHYNGTLTLHSMYAIYGASLDNTSPPNMYGDGKGYLKTKQWKGLYPTSLKIGTGRR